LADAYARGAASLHEVRRIEVAALDFPVLRLPADWHHGHPVSDIVEAQEAIRWAEHLVLLFPLWMGMMPALPHAFLEQVARPGFAMEESAGFPKKLLGGRSAHIVVTMGMPTLAYRWYYRAHGVKALERNILRMAGIAPVRTTLIGGVDTQGADNAGWLERMEAAGRAGN
jgi:putative NADPH-quinone reductase